jgi:hypothetical protein
MSVTDRLLLPRYEVLGVPMFGTVEVTSRCLLSCSNAKSLPLTRMLRRTEGASRVCRAARSDDRPLRAG